jgi:hypothetical protein
VSVSFVLRLENALKQTCSSSKSRWRTKICMSALKQSQAVSQKWRTDLFPSKKVSDLILHVRYQQNIHQ